MLRSLKSTARSRSATLAYQDIARFWAARGALKWWARGRNFEKIYQRGPELHCMVTLQSIWFHIDRQTRAAQRLKRVVDFGLGWALLLALSPVLLVVAILIKLDSRGPVFFRQERAGKFGSPFLIWKFRTMVLNADTVFTPLRPLEKNLADPRSTRIGKVIRKRKLDELPQLLNVIAGDMSLVGPRPVPMEETATLPLRYHARFAVKPGMTGLWQASHPNTIRGRLKFAIDSYYALNWNLSLDFKLLLRTAGILFWGEDSLRPFQKRYTRRKPRKSGVKP